MLFGERRCKLFKRLLNQQVFILDNTENSRSKISKHLLTLFSFIVLILWDMINPFKKNRRAYTFFSPKGLMSLAFQIRASALNTVSSLVPEGNIPPHMWASNQQTSSYTRHTPVNWPTSSPSQLLCFQTLDLAQLPVGLVVFFFLSGDFLLPKECFLCRGTGENYFCWGCCHCAALFGQDILRWWWPSAGVLKDSVVPNL